MINVKRLKDIIKDLPDEMILVCSGSDHNYEKINSVYIIEAEDYENGSYGELPLEKSEFNIIELLFIDQ